MITETKNKWMWKIKNNCVGYDTWQATWLDHLQINQFKNPDTISFRCCPLFIETKESPAILD